MKLTICDKCKEQIKEAIFWHIEIIAEKVLDLDRENIKQKAEFDYHDRCYQTIREELKPR